MNLGSNRGFTLIELAVSASLLTIGIVALAITIANHVSTSIKADVRITALNIARGTLEQILQRRDQYGYTTTLSEINSNNFDQNPVTGFTSYVLDTSVQEVNPDYDNSSNDDFADSQASSGYARITVQVFFGTGTEHVELETLIAQF